MEEHEETRHAAGQSIQQASVVTGSKQQLSDTTLHGAERRMPKRERLRKRTSRTPQSPQAIRPAAPERHVGNNDKHENKSQETFNDDRLVVEHERDVSMGYSGGRAAKRKEAQPSARLHQKMWTP